jgi:hypothetical protein
MPADRMFLLQYGAEPSPKWISVRGGGDRCCGCRSSASSSTRGGLGAAGDGMSRAFLDDEALRRSVYTSEEQPWMTGDDPVAHALAGVGLAVGDLALAAVSHLHVDHAGGLRTLAAAGVPVAVQRTELAFARERARSPRPTWPRTSTTRPSPGASSTGTARSRPGIDVIATPATPRGTCPTASSWRRPGRGSSPWTPPT